MSARFVQHNTKFTGDTAIVTVPHESACLIEGQVVVTDIAGTHVRPIKAFNFDVERPRASLQQVFGVNPTAVRQLNQQLLASQPRAGQTLKTISPDAVQSHFAALIAILDAKLNAGDLANSDYGKFMHLASLVHSLQQQSTAQQRNRVFRRP